MGTAAVLPNQRSAQPAHGWQIGPIIEGRNYSVGMPLSPIPTLVLRLPLPNEGAGHVHYVTFSPGSLALKSKIVARYRVDASRTVRFIARRHPEQPATVSLYFQRRADNWNARGQYEHFRWFAPAAGIREITPGTHEMTVNLPENWTSVLGKGAVGNRNTLEAAHAETDRLGLLFGLKSGRGHGVFVTGHARFTLISFRII